MIESDSFLVCGAFDGEIDLLTKQKHLNVLNSGVGSHDSMFNLMLYLIRNRKIRSILFAGSAGAYPHSKLTIGDLIYSNSFVYREIAEIKKLAKVPQALNRNLVTQLDPRLESFLPSFKESTTNSPNYITMVELELTECVDFLFDVGVENMEAFGLAYIAYKFSIPFTACFYITNYVGPDGSHEWAENWREGSRTLQNHILKFLNT